MLVLKHCDIGYSEPLIRDVSCTMETGMIYGLSARNEMEKTTFLLYLSKLLPSISGCKEVIEDEEVKN